MRLQFNLQKVLIDPICHIQIVRHAQEYQNRFASGQIYGALYDDMAEVTNVMAFPDKLTKQELESMQKRYDENLANYTLDTDKLGWYMICYKRNFWDELESMKYYQKYIDTSFLLIFDEKSRIQGTNPYRAYRLKDQFAEKQNFKWSDLQNSDIQKDNPFVQIPVQVHKNQLFQVLTLYNKQSLLRTLLKNKQSYKQKQLKENIQQYMQAFDEQIDIQKSFNQIYLQPNLQAEQNVDAKNIAFTHYARIFAQNLKLANYNQYFMQYENKMKKYQSIFKQNE